MGYLIPLQNVCLLRRFYITYIYIYIYHLYLYVYILKELKKNHSHCVYIYVSRCLWLGFSLWGVASLAAQLPVVRKNTAHHEADKQQSRVRWRNEHPLTSSGCKKQREKKFEDTKRSGKENVLRNGTFICICRYKRYQSEFADEYNESTCRRSKQYCS